MDELSLESDGGGGLEMEYEQGAVTDCPVSEMAIVDTFTKLIFGQEQDYSPRELLIVQAFRLVEANVMRDTHQEMGEYLRSLGVREMIQLVSRLRDHMNDSSSALSSARPSALHPSAAQHSR